MSTSLTPIPGPPGVPLLGNIFDINQKNTWWSLKTLAEKYGEIFQIKALGHKIVFVASAALAEEICDEKRFRKYVGGPVEAIRYLTHDGLFTAYDNEPTWGIAHRIVAPQLSPDLIANHFSDFLSCTDELIAKWKALPTNTNTISPLSDLQRLNLEATTLTLFGQKLNCITSPTEHPVLQAMEDSTSEAMQRPSRPKLLTLLLHNSKWKKSASVQRTWAQSLINHRTSHPTDRQDLLYHLLNTPDPETSKTLTPSQVIDEICSMPIGSSTAPCSITSTIYFLTQNPSVVVTAREELSSVVGSGALTHAHLSQLPYITAIVRETLRLAYPAPGFNIEPIPREGDTSPILLGGGKYQIAHNQPMIIVLAGVNRDPAVFEEPLSFKPERMMGEKWKVLPKGVKKWFGNGKRECVGKHWAWDFLMVVTARLVMEVDFESVDGTEWFQDGWFNVRPVNFKVKVKARE